MKIKITLTHIIIIFILLLSIFFFPTQDNELIIPVKVHIITVEDSNFNSNRDFEDINRVFNGVNNIWSQANIKFIIDEITIESITTNVYQSSQNDLRIVLRNTSYNDKIINAYFMSNIGGPNGLAISNLKTIYIADFTSVNDFRATSHEFGHIFNLNHVPPLNRLMASGVNGTLISNEEINISRENAIDYIK